MAKMGILECLNNVDSKKVEYSSLGRFADSSNTTDSTSTANPNLKLTFKHMEKTVRSSTRRSTVPKTDIM